MSDSEDSLMLADLVKLGDKPEILDYWTLSFSPKQQCFHSEKLSIMLKENVSQLIQTDGECADFMIVGIGKELEDLTPIREKLEGRWKRRLHLVADEEGNLAKTVIHKDGSIEQTPYK
jgi:hypothetical protein